jgi:hypothetical protein
MGILDDAIREHLELKRRHGAASSDLERLEKEAFGPSERPGEPESEEAPIPEPEAEFDARPAEGLEQPAEETVDQAGGTDSEWLEELEFESSGEAEPEGAKEASPSSEQARIEHPELGDTVDHPAVEPEAAEEPAEAPEAEPVGQGEIDEEEDFDLELELPEDAAQEHPLPEQPGGEEGFEADDSEEDELEDEDEDLLEETPDFLEDTPEGERLWFEQRGKPKDFDFDE